MLGVRLMSASVFVGQRGCGVCRVYVVLALVCGTVMTVCEAEYSDGSFFLASEDFGGTFDDSFPASALFMCQYNDFFLLLQ